MHLVLDVYLYGERSVSLLGEEGQVTLSIPKLYFLYRCFLAAHFTSRTRHTVRALTPIEVKELEVAGLVANHGRGWRCTEAGLAELTIAGIDLRNVGVAEDSWRLRYAQ